MKKCLSGKDTILQFIKFGIVGAFNTVLSYSIYTISYYVLDFNMHISNAMGFVISVFSAYLLQSCFVFKQETDIKGRIWWKVLIKTYISYSFTGLILTEILLVFWIDVLDLEQYLRGICQWLYRKNITIESNDLAVSVAPLLNMLITIPTNFLINKYWAYRQIE